MDFHSGHLRVLQECRRDLAVTSKMAAGAPGPWLRDIDPAADWASLPHDRCTREDVFRFLATEPPISLAVGCILGWGGMHRQHGRRLFGMAEWYDIATQLRGGKLDRQTAYQRFADLRARGGLPGMGPAYFTKLIFFLMSEGRPSLQPGYIMDQWTACSVNLLLDDPAAVLIDASYSWSKASRLESQYTVSDINDGQGYERFCSAIEALSRLLDLSATNTELLLLSEGGKRPLRWRSHVKEHRRPPLHNQRSRFAA